MATTEELLIKVALAADDGLTLTSAAALHDVPPRLVGVWVRKAEDGEEPYEAWLTGILKRHALKRQAYLLSLAEKAQRPGRRGSWRARDLARMQSAPSELEKEIRELRTLRWNRKAK